jgi:hypothetical protein
MKYSDLIKFYGTESRAATAGKYDRQRVYAWRNAPRIPTDCQIRYEVLTVGKLRADVPETFRRICAHLI